MQLEFGTTRSLYLRTHATAHKTTQVSTDDTKGSVQVVVEPTGIVQSGSPETANKGLSASNCAQGERRGKTRVAWFSAFDKREACDG